MKNRRNIIFIVLLNLVLVCALTGVLLLSNRLVQQAPGSGAEVLMEEPDLVIVPPEEIVSGDGEKQMEAVSDDEDMAADGDDVQMDDTQNPPDEQKEPVSETENAATAQKDAWIQEKLASMTIEEKVAQLFVLCPERLTGVSHVVAAGEVTKNAIDSFPVGGIIYMGSNIETPQQITEMIAHTQAYAMDRIGIPLFISVDEEGGYVTRIAKNSNFHVPQFSYASELGKSGDTSAAYEMGAAVGEYLEAYGFNVDFAPVADVLSNAENQVVKKRSFGSDAQLVSDMVLAELDGLASHNILGCVKHFPGHGATVGDTHEGYAYTDKTWDELLTCEIVPFSDSIAKGVPMIMVGHISLPNVVGDGTPASMSECMVTGHLRNELGYDGIVITDSLGMGAITDAYSSKQAAVSVLKAGGDMLLDPVDFKSAYEGILSEIASGGISEERIDESVCRILNVKYTLLENR